MKKLDFSTAEAAIILCILYSIDYTRVTLMTHTDRSSSAASRRTHQQSSEEPSR